MWRHARMISNMCDVIIYQVRMHPLSLSSSNLKDPHCEFMSSRTQVLMTKCSPVFAEKRNISRCYFYFYDSALGIQMTWYLGGGGIQSTKRGFDTISINYAGQGKIWTYNFTNVSQVYHRPATGSKRLGSWSSSKHVLQLDSRVIPLYLWLSILQILDF